MAITIGLRIYLAILCLFALCYSYLVRLEEEEIELPSAREEDLTDINVSNMEMEGNDFQDSLQINIYKPLDNSNKLSNLTANYIQRYISLFLKLLDLKDHSVTSTDEDINLNLLVRIRGSDLIYLQNYSSSVESLQRDFTRLENILVKMIEIKPESKVQQATNFLMDFLETVTICLKSEPLNNPHVIIFIVTILFVGLFLKKSYVSVYTAVLGAVNNIIIYEGYVDYKKKLHLSMQSMEESYNMEANGCNVWISWFFSSAHCKENLDNAAEKGVSLLYCILDTYASYLIEMPFKIFGMVSNKLAKQFTGQQHWLLQPFSETGVSIIMAIILAIVILIMSGIGLNVSFFGCSLRVGKPQVIHVERVALSSSKHKPLSGSSETSKTT